MKVFKLFLAVIDAYFGPISGCFQASYAIPHASKANVAAAKLYISETERLAYAAKTGKEGRAYKKAVATQKVAWPCLRKGQ